MYLLKFDPHGCRDIEPVNKLDFLHISTQLKTQFPWYRLRKRTDVLRDVPPSYILWEEECPMV